MGFDTKKFKALVTSLSLGVLGAEGGLGCSSSDDSNGSGSNMACVPGDQKACACPGGNNGVQICRADGGGYDACTGCGAPMPGTGGSAVPGGGGTNAGGTGGTGATISACDGCRGCCDGSECVAPADQSAQQCGSQGSMCASCEVGEICISGECKVNTGECSPATCPAGCCYEGSCLLQADQNYLYCGGGGGECSPCEFWGAVCAEGTCTTQIDPSAAPFLIFVDSLKVTEKNSAGDAWDLLGGLPDPVVCFSAGETSGCTTVAQDTTMPTWEGEGPIAGEVGTAYFTGGDFSGPVHIAVWDSDSFGNELMASLVYPEGITELANEYVITNQGAIIELRWRLR